MAHPWLIPALPLASALVLLLGAGRLPRRAVAVLGTSAVAGSALATLFLLADFALAAPASDAVVHSLWRWMDVGGFRPEIALRLDALSLTMATVVSGVGLLILLYSVGFMAGEAGYARFFGCMNLFVAAMLTLVLADDLLLLYLGWEGVGLCSYLLIGFWYQDRNNERAARKAFIVTRIGDTALAIGLLLLFSELRTLHIQEVVLRARDQWTPGAALPVAATLLVLGGAVGKSAQLPLQVWLPDAMAGPTPTSALIHAATMVTAGVWLIARLHGIFELAPQVQLVVAAIGAVTLLLAASSALVQTDIKRVLAYSTMSQIGYMFLALGVGAWTAAIFHLVTHATFKALLFLAAGVVIKSTPEHEHHVLKMGGLRHTLPLAFWSFLIGSSALAGVPLVTAGYFSKEKILWQTWASPAGGPLLYLAAMAGVLLTALYAFRLVFLVFFGPPATHPVTRPGRGMRVPLYVLAFLALTAGYLDVSFGTQAAPVFSAFLYRSLPAPTLAQVGPIDETTSAVLASALLGAGVLAAWVLARQQRARGLVRAGAWAALASFSRTGWGFDRLNHRLWVRPLQWFGSAGRWDSIDAIYEALAELSRDGHRVLSMSQTGRMRTYVTGLALGALVFLAVVLAS